MKDITQKENDLIYEINKYAEYLMDNNQLMDIVLSAKQFKEYKAICAKIKENKADRMGKYRFFDTKESTYMGFLVREKETARKPYTEKSLESFNF